MHKKSPNERVNISMQTLKLPIVFIAIFTTVAVSMALLLDSLFYLFNFLYIGFAVALGIFVNYPAMNYRGFPLEFLKMPLI